MYSPSLVTTILRPVYVYTPVTGSNLGVKSVVAGPGSATVPAIRYALGDVAVLDGG